MCSASSSGVSMWPNITVDVERRPGAVGGLDDLDPAARPVSLFGEIRLRTPSSSTSAAVPGVEPSPQSRR